MNSGLKLLLSNLIKYPNIRSEVENIFLAANLIGYECVVSMTASSNRETAYCCTFYLNEKKIHMDINFKNQVLTDICACEGDSKPRCCSEICKDHSCALSIIKNLL